MRVKLPSFHATFENSKRNSNTNGELMRGESGGRINIYSEDLSVPSQTNEFRFRTSHFITTDGLNIQLFQFTLSDQSLKPTRQDRRGIWDLNE